MTNFTGIKTIFWDFDGVIMDSMPIRDLGFSEVLKVYPEDQVSQLMAYHKANGGLSRYVKFRYFFEEIRNEKVSEEEVQELANSFSSIMLSKLKNPQFLIHETVNFIKHNYQKYIMLIVSGSDQVELREICETLEIQKYFKGIYGSPIPKKQLVQNVIEIDGLCKSEACLIGDSINDYEAARENDILFYGFNNPELLKVSKNYISKFS